MELYLYKWYPLLPVYMMHEDLGAQKEWTKRNKYNSSTIYLLVATEAGLDKVNFREVSFPLCYFNIEKRQLGWSIRRNALY